MSRTLRSIVCAAVLLWCGGAAMAFTLQIGAYPPADGFEAAQTTHEADIPTPQLFRVVISRDGVRTETPPVFATNPAAAPDVRVQYARPVQTTEAVDTGRGTTTAHHLSGAEILLLRQAETVVANPDQGTTNN
jgi:hypothetical protein